MSFLESTSYLAGGYLGEEEDTQLVEPPENAEGPQLPVPANMNLEATVILPVLGPIKVKTIVLILALAAGVWWLTRQRKK